MDTTRWGEAQPGGDVPQGMEYVTPAASDALDAPQDPDYPFEEPETAPELRQQRSESLYSRSAPFWERVVELPPEGEDYPLDPEYWNHPEELREGVIMRVESERPAEKLRRRLTSRPALYTYGVLVVLAAVAFFVHSVFATVRSINVEGNVNFTDEQIISLSGLEKGMSTFGIDEDAVMGRIGRERYLRCTLVDVSFDSVTIHVRERVPASTIVQNGRRIILDDRGWVLEISDDMYSVPQGLVSVTGLDVHSCTLGQSVTLRRPERLTTYTQILIELRALGGLGMVTELDMTTMDSITLTTTDGITVLLGDESNIHQKIRAMLVVHDNLLLNDFYGAQPGGTIVVADPTSPAYRPPEG